MGAGVVPRVSRAVALAAVASVVPWLLGGIVAVRTHAHGGFPLTSSGAFAGLGAARWVASADAWFSVASFTLPVVAVVLMVLWLVALAPRSRWTAAALDTAVLALVVLLMAFGDGLVDSAGSASGYAFGALLIALVTLQLPLCFALSAWLAPVLGALGRPARRRDAWAA